MKILKWMKKEKSGLAFTTLELAKYEERLGNTVAIRQPGEDAPISGPIFDPDLHTVHSQLGLPAYFDRKAKIMWMHGEPLSSVGNGVSMKAIVDLAPTFDAFICMRREEWPIWNSIKRTHLVPKGIDLEVFKPLPGLTACSPSGAYLLQYSQWSQALSHHNEFYVCPYMFPQCHDEYMLSPDSSYPL